MGKHILISLFQVQVMLRQLKRAERLSGKGQIKKFTFTKRDIQEKLAKA
jgi:hypothetical protein